MASKKSTAKNIVSKSSRATSVAPVTAVAKRKPAAAPGKKRAVPARATAWLLVLSLAGPTLGLPGRGSDEARATGLLLRTRLAGPLSSIPR